MEARSARAVTAKPPIQIRATAHGDVITRGKARIDAVTANGGLPGELATTGQATVEAARARDVGQETSADGETSTANGRATRTVCEPTATSTSRYNRASASSSSTVIEP